jgi:outer membrane receptor protein involved in Fe transport
MLPSTTKIRRTPFLLALAICCHFQLSANAQSANEIKGQVNDESGQPVTYASVVAKNQTTGATTSTQTDSLGIFTYRNLAAGGPYSFVVSHVGFQTQTLSGYDIKTDANISLLIKLRPVENGLNEVIVTGRAGALNRTKLKTSYSVTSIGYNALSLQAPTSVTETLKSVPGFWVEATGGEASGNVRARGVPVDGFGSIQLLEDGIPVQHDPALGYLNGDQAFRFDETIQSIEVVRGGPSAVFYSNAPAGAVNYIPRAVGDKTEGIFKLTVGDFNLNREDFWLGSPIGDGWKIAAGGFYRTGTGVRNPGYNGNHGGQIRATIGKSWEKSSFSLDYKQLNDDVVFYTDLPMTYNSSGKIVGVSGFDGNYGAIAGAETSRLNMVQGDSSLYHYDNTVGTSVNRSQVTLKFQTELADDWILKNSFRYNNTQTQRNGLFALNLLTADSFYKVQSGLLSQAPGATQLGFQYVTTGAMFDNANQNGNAMVIQGGLRGITMPMTEMTNDLHLSHVFYTGGSKHDFNLGYYYAHFDQNFSRYSSRVYLDVQNNARLLNIVALDGTGKIVHTYSDNGVSQYGYEWADARGEQTTNALYISDEWQITRAFRLDGGLRWENAQTNGVVEQSKTVNLGTYATSQINTGNGLWLGYNHHFDYTTWTLGADYELSPNMGLFGRYTSAARIPGFGTYYTNVNSTAVTQTMQLAEVGYKYARRLYSLYATGFFTRYNNVGFTNTVSTVGGSYTQVNAFANTNTLGLELEGSLFPVQWFDVSATATLQHGVYDGLVAEAVSGGTLTEKYNYNGNKLIRVPQVSVRVVPGFNLFGTRLRLQAPIEYEGKRYTDVANTQILPAYTKLDLNAQVNITHEVSVFGIIDNVTNSLGLTEGNPRAGEIESAEANSYIFLARPLLGRSFKVSLRYKF